MNIKKRGVYPQNQVDVPDSRNIQVSQGRRFWYFRPQPSHGTCTGFDAMRIFSPKVEGTPRPVVCFYPGVSGVESFPFSGRHNFIFNTLP